MRVKQIPLWSRLDHTGSSQPASLHWNVKASLKASLECLRQVYQMRVEFQRHTRTRGRVRTVFSPQNLQTF